MFEPVGIGGEDREAGDVHYIRQRRDAGRDKHVDVNRREIRVEGILLAVPAGEVEFMAKEAGHVRITWQRGVSV